MIKETEIAYVHIYHKENMSSLGVAINTAEKLGYSVAVRPTYDAQNKVHSLQVFAQKDVEVGTPDRS